MYDDFIFFPSLFDSVDSLTHDQHLALLTFLCDAALESEKMRGVLQRELAPCFHRLVAGRTGVGARLQAGSVGWEAWHAAAFVGL